MIDIAKSIKEITDYAKENLSEKRFSHSLFVAGTTATLCAKYGVKSIEEGFLAGISHDICKELEIEEINGLIKKHKIELGEIEKAKPSLLHGKFAAILLQEKFKIFNQDILDSVEHHTFGKKNLCDLGLLLFVADKIEPTRKNITCNYLRSLQDLSHFELIEKVAKENFNFIANEGKTMSNSSIEFLNWLGEKNEKK